MLNNRHKTTGERFEQLIGDAERQGAGSGFDEKRVAMTVIATFEFDDLFATGEAMPSVIVREPSA